jgi:hypothetical protein
MGNLKITDLKKYLKNKNEEELLQEILTLAKAFKDVKEYYNLKINPESEKEILEKYKKIVNNEFLPDRGFGKMRYSVVNDAIKEFQKISNTPENIAELMLFYGEIGVEFTNIYGDIDEKFYNNIARAYDNALEYIQKSNLESMFKERASEIQYEASDIGWGFGDYISELYCNYYGWEDEEEE